MKNGLGLLLGIGLGMGIGDLGLAGRPALATSYTNTIAQMSNSIVAQMAQGGIQGLSIILVDDQSVVWSAGFGYADREQGIVPDADTVYHVGSVSKAFAATAAMQLMDDGLLDLEAPLTQYMAEFSMLPRYTHSGPVTIRSLLNHHSGLPGDFFNGMWTAQPRDDYMSWLLDYLRGDYTFMPVNVRYSYCNTGWVIISDVIRRIDGRSFASATDARIFAPLGMDASSFLPDKAAISNRLAACYNEVGQRQPPEYLNCLGSGSMYSSVNDLARYIRLILADGRWNGQSLISSNAIEIMATPQLTNLPLNVTDGPQGLGWDNADDKKLRYAGRLIWKDGGTLFYCSYLGISRDLKLGVAVIQNSPGSQCDAIGLKTLRWAVLDKQGVHWPTNAFVPTPSPLTNWPQADLDALAGLYVGNMGYNTVVAEPGALTVTLNAHTATPTVSSNWVPRANGWFSKADSQAAQFAFTNLAGYDSLVFHGVDGAYEDVSPLGERYVLDPLSAAWSNRTQRVYRIQNMRPDDYMWDQPYAKTFRLRIKDGALFTDWMYAQSVLQPQSDILAFQRGLYYRKGGALRVLETNGFEILQHSSFRFIDEAAIPTLAVNSVNAGAIPFAYATQWYWVSGQSGQTYQVRLTAPGYEYAIRMTDRDGFAVTPGTTGCLTWNCTSNGTYALAICSSQVFSYAVSVTIRSLRQTQNDFDGDGKADPAAYAAAAGLWRVALSGSGYARQAAALGSAISLECAADFDGDAKADLAVYEPATGCWRVLMSAQNYALTTAILGGPGGVPVVADFDGDRKADPSMYDVISGRFMTWLSGSAYALQATVLGGTGWQAVAEDYDGDGKTDPAVYDTAGGTWCVLLSGSGYALAQARVLAPGTSSLQPCPADYDGDGKADLMVYNASAGAWACALSDQNYAVTLLSGLGGPALVPRPADYDGDGKADPAVYDPVSRVFYVLLSGSGYALAALAL